MAKKKPGKVAGKRWENRVWEIQGAARIRRYPKVLVGQDVERQLAGKIIGIIFVVVPLLSALSSGGNRGFCCFFRCRLGQLVMIK